MKLVEKIKEYRQKNEISQRELARRLNIDSAYMTRIENNKIDKISIKLLNKICNELQLNFLQELIDMYNSDEINLLNVFQNINDVYNFIDKKTIKKYSIIDENENERLSIINVLNGYKNNEIDENQMIGILSTIFNTNVYNLLTKQELEKIKK